MDELCLTSAEGVATLVLIVLLVGRCAEPPGGTLLVGKDIAIMGAQPTLSPESTTTSSVPKSVYYELRAPTQVPVNDTQVAGTTVEVVTIPID